MVGRYQTVQRIASGGVGVIYEALDTNLDRRVAIKRLLPPEESHDYAQLSQDLMAEAAVLSGLQHPNILTIYDAGSDPDGSFVVTEFVDGETLEKTVERGAFPLEDFVPFAEQLLEGVIAAHAAAILHRDLKPANVMLKWLPSGSFHVKILDFGLAKFSPTPEYQTRDHSDAILGTVAFMAPEQFERELLDVRTDLYSLGCLFYYILTGKRPFRGTKAVTIMRAHLNNEVTHLHEIRPDLPPALCDWVMWHINVSPDDRPAAGKYSLDVLKLALAGQAAMDINPEAIAAVASKEQEQEQAAAPKPDWEVKNASPSATQFIPVVAASTQKLRSLSAATAELFRKRKVPGDADATETTETSTASTTNILPSMPSWISTSGAKLDGAGENLRALLEQWKSEEFRKRAGKVVAVLQKEYSLLDAIPIDKEKVIAVAQEVSVKAKAVAGAVSEKGKEVVGEVSASTRDVAGSMASGAKIVATEVSEKSVEVAKVVASEVSEKGKVVAEVVSTKSKEVAEVVSDKAKIVAKEVAEDVSETLGKEYTFGEAVERSRVSKLIPKKTTKRVFDQVVEFLTRSRSITDFSGLKGKPRRYYARRRRGPRFFYDTLRYVKDFFTKEYALKDVVIGSLKKVVPSKVSQSMKKAASRVNETLHKNRSFGGIRQRQKQTAENLPETDERVGKNGNENEDGNA